MMTSVACCRYCFVTVSGGIISTFTANRGVCYLCDLCVCVCVRVCLFVCVSVSPGNIPSD